MSSPTKNAPDLTASGPGAGGIGGIGNQKIPGGPTGLPVPMPGLSGSPNGPFGNLIKGPVDNNGKLKDAALTVGIKLDLEAEVHLTARVRGDILVALY
ncbi:hypothetical protein LARI1_G002289 [Lachnellula arida]|uniref:Uncharacterized protein n=2 Tax=Lachnellula TaxID=47830 RepID=A0A8T9BQ44_9HELO|nr:hypothetical protein LARI1_G002289 [Lachnellula arida]TVY86871.1 hypothetical protein LAWI1_G006696 [Lachnellula willkommii]